MDTTKLEKMIKEHEGFREKIYKDTNGILTAGYGHALIEGTSVAPEVIDFWWEKDLATALGDLGRLMENYQLDGLSEVRQMVLTDMMFNLGYGRFIKFQRLIAAMQRKDYEGAAKEMLDSLWARQVKKRSQDLAMMMQTDTMPTG